jgi:hypothetical protein
MQVIENWADVEGQVEAIEPEQALPGYRIVRMRIDSAANVGGFANLVAGHVGHSLKVHVPEAKIKELQLEAGKRMTCRMRQGGPLTYFAHV